MICPLCGLRKARRVCPAVGERICTVCCGTKRLVEISCPPDCVYLSTAREHPPAAVLRQHQRDVQLFLEFVRDLNQRQSQLFYVLHSFLAGYQGSDLHPLVDDDVAEATAAIAATLETSSRGVIYEHRPASLQAERLVAALKPVLAEVGGPGGSAVERDTAVVMRRIAEAVRAVRASDPGNSRAFLDLIGRIIRKTDDEGTASKPADEPPRLIVP